MYAVGVGFPETWDVCESVAVICQCSGEGHNDVTGDVDEGSDVSDADVFSVAVVEVGCVAHLVESFPLFFDIPLARGVFDEEVVFVYECVGDVVDSVVCFECAQAKIRVVAENKQVFVG